SCSSASIHGTLRMNNPADKLVADYHVYWYTTALADVSQGIIELGGNWNVYNGAQVVLPAAVSVYLKGTAENRLIHLASSTAQMGNLTIGRDSSGGTYTGGVYTISSGSTRNLILAGGLYIEGDNELDLNQRSLVMDGELDLHGKLDIHSNTASVHGECNLEYLSHLSVGDGFFLCDDAEIPHQIDLHGTISIGTGTCELAHKGLQIWSSGLLEMEGGTLICYSILAGEPNTVQPAAGTVIFPERLVSGGAYGIFVTNGNWLPNLTIDAGDDWFFLVADLTIKGDFNFLSGYLTATDLSTAEDRNIQIEGDWNNLGGNFQPQTGRVIFTGFADQFITADEIFNILETAKPINSALEVSPGAEVSCAAYDWTSGSLRVNGSAFSAAGLADDGIFGAYMLQSGGTLNLSNPGGRIDLNGLLYIYSGTVNVYGGTHISTWSFGGNAYLHLEEPGTLNFHDQGIYIYNSATYTFGYNILGGTITTTGDLLCSRPGFSPGAGTFEFLGASNNSVNFTAAGCGLFNLSLNKPLANYLLLNNYLACAGNVSLSSGELKVNGQTLGCGGSLTVGGTAILDLAQNSRLEMAGNISAASGALIRSLGSVSLPCRVTRQGTGYYGFTLNSGATLHAQHTIFEYGSANGLFVRNGATVTSLDNCTFQNGISQGNLLTIGNTQDLTVLNAVFPDNTWDGAHNVRKVMDAGTVFFQGFSGDFAGAAFEDDEFNRLFWTGGDPDLRIFQVLWSDTGPYLCDPLTATVSVFNDSAYDVTEPFRVDLYYHSGTVPPPGALGDRFLDFPCLSGGETKTAQITNISSDEAVTWNSWVVVDAAGQIAESNENNNVWSLPIITQWQPLPPAYDLSIVPHPTLPGQVYITWEYDLSVSQYKIYKDSDPCGSFSTLAGTASSKRFAEPASTSKPFTA
ncbi:MAG: CARDB domain-containing protein, partial [Candidatus Cloacimonetes bacterium]|nr:CARDB domain-containing protein [Candidatus Cloacimonadota bacterium]